MPVSVIWMMGLSSGIGGGRRRAGHTAQRVPLIGFGPGPGLPSVAVLTQAADLPPHSEPVPSTHAHDFIQLVHVEHGRHRLRVEDRDWQLVTGDALVIAPGSVIATRHTQTDPDTAMWVVLFSGDAADPATILPASWRAHPLLSSLTGTGRGAHRFAIPREDQTLLLLQLSGLDLDMPFDMNRDSSLAAVFHTIATRYQESISLTDIAVAVAQSPGHLATVVKQRTGRTVGQWLTERRMREARRLLADTNRPISEIATRVGYRDPGYFTRRFQAEHQMAPQAWRRAGRTSP